METKGNRGRIWITIGIVLVIILILVYFVDWEAVLLIFRLTDWRIFAFGAISLFLGFVLISIRYRKILANTPSLMKTYHSDSIGYMVTMLTPVPAPALRTVTLNQVSGLPFHYVSSGMVVETLLGVVMRILALIVVILLTTKITESIISVIISVGVIVLTFVGIIWLVNHAEQALAKIGGWIKRLPISNVDSVDQTLADIETGVKEVGSNRTLTIGMVYSVLMWGFFLIFLFLAWVALPVELSTREMVTLAAASLVLVPPSAPAMVGVYQGVLVGSLLLLRITDVTNLTAYAILVFTIQLVFWVIMGVWALSRTDLKIKELIDRTRNIRGDEFLDD
jgi:uncharacterized protein (TIRG00374 family)